MSTSGVTRQGMKYNILSILSRGNKVLSLDDVNIYKRNPHNQINEENITQIKPIALDFTIYEPYFDFIFVGAWEDPMVSNNFTYFGFVNSEYKLPKDVKVNPRFNVLKLYASNQLIYVSTLETITVSDYYRLIEQDIRDYNINKLVN